jgi:hypothetical protein
MTRPVSRRTDQRFHHEPLLRHFDWRHGAAPIGGRPLDAIVVPASRRAHHLDGVIDLAARYGATLVVLASHRCEIEEAAELVASTPGSGRAVLAKVPANGKSELLDLATSADWFRDLSGGRTSNLSLKRNIGLLLARYRGWQKIMFLDDDIIHLTLDQVARVAHLLDSNRYAGLRTVKYPDNSVVCHANRAIGRPQGIFVSGAALGVRTAYDVKELDVFPDVYNEDWFALAGEAGTTGVAHVGDVRQLEFNPFEDPQRAAHEEFGDLLAEGLYALFNDGLGSRRASLDYWDQFIDERFDLIKDIRWLLERDETHRGIQASRSLEYAQRRLRMIQPDDCTAFLEAWEDDRKKFAHLSQARRRHYDYREAFVALGITQWQEARSGIVRMPGVPTVTRRRAATAPRSGPDRITAACHPSAGNRATRTG